MQGKDHPEAVYKGLAASGMEREESLEGEAVHKKGKGVQSHHEGHLKRTQDDFSSSSGVALAGDEVDFSTQRDHSRGGQQVSLESSSGSDKAAGGDISILTPAIGGAALTTKLIYNQEGTASAGDGSAETAESPRQGAGAFTPFRRESSLPHSSTPTQDTMGTAGQYESSRREFEAWLCRENELLAGILSTRGAALSKKELKMRQDMLIGLRARVAEGQERFQLLLQEAGPVEDVGLEELRYRWMLYKSKLKDVGEVRARVGSKKAKAKKEEPVEGTKLQKRPSLLQRVCRCALPLWLLLLALLLLAFLLPLMDEGSSCSLSNNFARSFNIMLRYEGPPPT